MSPGCAQASAGMMPKHGQGRVKAESREVAGEACSTLFGKWSPAARGAKPLLVGCNVVGRLRAHKAPWSCREGRKFSILEPDSL